MKIHHLMIGALFCLALCESPEYPAAEYSAVSGWDLPEWRAAASARPSAARSLLNFCVDCFPSF